MIPIAFQVTFALFYAFHECFPQRAEAAFECVVWLRGDIPDGDLCLTWRSNSTPRIGSDVKVIGFPCLDLQLHRGGCHVVILVVDSWLFAFRIIDPVSTFA